MTIDKIPLLIFALSLLQLYFLFRCVQAARRHRRISSITPTKVSDLQKGSSRRTDWVALEGTVSCKNPLKSRYFSTPCVFYRSEINPKSGLRKATARYFSKSEGVLFELSDETGSVLVDPQGAEVVSDQVSDFRLDIHKKRGFVDSLVDPVLGGLLAQIGITNEALARSDLENQNFGELKGSYCCSETVLPAGDTLFAVGQLRDVSGRLVLTTSGRERTPTILTNLTRTSYLRRLHQTVWNCLVGIVLNALVIAIAVYVGFRHFGMFV